MEAAAAPPLVGTPASLRFRRLLWLGLVVVNLFVGGIVALALYQGMCREQRLAELTTQNLSRALEESTIGLIGRIDLTLLAVRDEVLRQQAAGGIDKAALNAVLARYDSRLPDALGLRVVDAGGAIRYAVNGVMADQANIADRAHFTRLRDDPDVGLNISKPVLGRVEQQWVVTLSRRIDNPDGSFAGAVYVAVALDHFSRSFADLHLGSRGSVSLWDEGQTLLARYSAEAGFMGDRTSVRPSPELEELILTGTPSAAFHTRSRTDGVVRTFAFRKVGNYPLFLTVGLADDDYLSDWRRQAWQMGGMALLFMLATLLSGGLVARGWNRRQKYNRLVEQAREEAEAARRRNEQILSWAGEGICGVDSAGRITFINPAARWMLGWTDSEGIGDSLHDRTHHHHADGSPFPACDCIIYQVLQDGLSRHADEGIYWRKDGSSFLVEFSATAIVEGGRIVGAVNVFRDISVAREAAARLAESHELDQAVIAGSSVAIAVFHHDGHCVLVNDAYAQLAGGSREQMLEQNFHTIRSWQEYGILDTALEALATGQPVTLSRHMRSTFGRDLWLEARLVRITRGGAPHLLFLGNDVSEQKRIEESLRASEERFRTLIENTTDWIWETDDNQCFTWLSPSFTEVIGIPVDAVIGRRRWDMASTDRDIDATLWQGYIEDLSARRSFRDFRYWLDRGDGTSKWISVSGSPRFDQEGTFLGYRGVGADISAEAAAALRLKMLSTVVDQSPVSVVITSPNGAIEYVNAHFTLVTGYSAEEMKGANSRILASGETPHEVYVDLWRTITAGKRWTGELKNRRKNGECHWELVAISPVVNEVGQIVHFVSIKEDVTFRKAAEARIVEANRQLEWQSRQLEQTNAELEQFAYVASHDLRQPLRMVTSYLGMIEKKLGSNLSDDIRTCLGFAINGARRMDRLILDLLQYSRTGRNDAPVEPIALAETVGEALQILDMAIHEVEGKVSVAEGLPTVSGNRSDLVRLFQNLIGNAIKYRSPERGPVVEVGWRADGEMCVVWVKDNGNGIAPDDRERAFGIFQRLVRNDAKVEGTGIGLAVCKKIVEHHGGRIWIESQLGQGSTFLFTLPYRSPASA
jgi:PAS domain S-box-containing protein